MKFLPIFIASACALGVAAQGSFIALPPSGANVTPGKHLTVKVVLPDSIESSIEAGLVIGLRSCGGNPNECPAPGVVVGNVLFNGNFKPAFHEPGQQPYQNFSVTVPTGFTAGQAQLSTSRFFLIGAGPAPLLAFSGVTVNVV